MFILMISIETGTEDLTLHITVLREHLPWTNVSIRGRNAAAIRSRRQIRSPVVHERSPPQIESARDLAAEPLLTRVALQLSQ